MLSSLLNTAFQTQSFFGVGTDYQNTFAKQSIQTIMDMAWTVVVRVSLHWTKYGADSLALWGSAVKHAVWFHNCSSNCLSDLINRIAHQVQAKSL